MPVAPAARPAAMPSRIAARSSSDERGSTGVKITISASASARSSGDLDRLPVRVGPGRRHHVDRIADARLRRQKRAQPRARLVRELGDRQAGRFARVDRQDAGPAGVGDNRDAAPGGSGCASRQAAMSNISSMVSARITPD